MRELSILFTSSEAYPLMKTGGLGDIAGSLPHALCELGHDVRLTMPAYLDTLDRLDDVSCMASFSLDEYQVRLLECLLPASQVKVWLVDCEPLFGRAGNPYLDDNGKPYPDNAERFALFCRAVVELVMDRAGMDWSPDVVHCNDWQSGLVPALLKQEKKPPASLFTIHNLAYQGVFSLEVFRKLKLPDTLWKYEALEFFGDFSFIKGGLVFADQINTVSPRYAEEIQTPAFGCGLDGLLRHRSDDLSGILNGIDYREWDPENDPFLEQPFSTKKLKNKTLNKTALQVESGLPVSEDTMLLGVVGRLVEQKGIDLIIDALPEIFELPIQMVLLGSGEQKYQQVLELLAQEFPDNLHVHLGYDEKSAHRIEAGADCFLMPSRFEPCGLNQMYSLHYGTVPIVSNVGGLADTVVDADEDTIESEEANGFVIRETQGETLALAVQRAHVLYSQKKTWKRLQLSGMNRDFSWHSSAASYLELYLRTMRQ